MEYWQQLERPVMSFPTATLRAIIMGVRTMIQRMERKLGQRKSVICSLKGQVCCLEVLLVTNISLCLVWKPISFSGRLYSISLRPDMLIWVNSWKVGSSLVVELAGCEEEICILHQCTYWEQGCQEGHYLISHAKLKNAPRDLAEETEKG